MQLEIEVHDQVEQHENRENQEKLDVVFEVCDWDNFHLEAKAFQDCAQLEAVHHKRARKQELLAKYIRRTTDNEDDRLEEQDEHPPGRSVLVL